LLLCSNSGGAICSFETYWKDAFFLSDGLVKGIDGEATLQFGLERVGRRVLQIIHRKVQDETNHPVQEDNNGPVLAENFQRK
jgi:hypothetical protein